MPLLQELPFTSDFTILSTIYWACWCKLLPFQSKPVCSLRKTWRKWPVSFTPLSRKQTMTEEAYIVDWAYRKEKSDCTLPMITASKIVCLPECQRTCDFLQGDTFNIQENKVLLSYLMCFLLQFLLKTWTPVFPKHMTRMHELRPKPSTPHRGLWVPHVLKGHAQQDA